MLASAGLAGQLRCARTVGHGTPSCERPPSHAIHREARAFKMCLQGIDWSVYFGCSDIRWAERERES